MVYFKIVERTTFFYCIFRRWLASIFSYAYYRRFYVFGKKNLPKAGSSFMMVGNHQNGLIDALAILFAMPLRYKVVFLARADIFKKKLTAKILNFCKIMPVYRQRDGRDNLSENAAIFDESAKLVGMGFPVTLFPEGRHQEGHYLGQIKKGFARIAFEAAERNDFPEEMVIVPVGNHYSDYFARRARLMVRFGEPIRLSRYYAEYRENPPRAMTLLAEEVQTALQNLMLDIPDPENYADYDFLREVVRPRICREQDLNPDYFPDQFRADRIFAKRLGRQKDNLPEIRQKTSQYRSRLETLHLGSESVSRPATLGMLVLRFLLLLLGLPVALYGICFTGLPVWIGRSKSASIARSIKNPMLRTSFDFVLTQLIFTGLFYLLYIVAYWVALSFCPVGATWAWGGFFLFLASLVLTRAFWQDYLAYAKRFGQQARGFWLFSHSRLLPELQEEADEVYRLL